MRLTSIEDPGSFRCDGSTGNILQFRSFLNLKEIPFDPNISKARLPLTFPFLIQLLMTLNKILTTKTILIHKITQFNITIIINTLRWPPLHLRIRIIIVHILSLIIYLILMF